jgi:hypothetical protein
MGRPSITLAQAFQFEVMLRQKDVIGEWAPGSEPGVSAVTHAGQKWLDECGIPEGRHNMDSRTGAISEAIDAGTDLKHVRRAATHGEILMTQKYSRGGVETTAKGDAERAAHRNSHERNDRANRGERDDALTTLRL